MGGPETRPGPEVEPESELNLDDYLEDFVAYDFDEMSPEEKERFESRLKSDPKFRELQQQWEQLSMEMETYLGIDMSPEKLRERKRMAEEELKRALATPGFSEFLHEEMARRQRAWREEMERQGLEWRDGKWRPKKK